MICGHCLKEHQIIFKETGRQHGYSKKKKKKDFEEIYVIKKNWLVKISESYLPFQNSSDYNFKNRVFFVSK